MWMVAYCIVSDKVAHAVPNIQQEQLLFVNVTQSQLKKLAAG